MFGDEEDNDEYYVCMLTDQLISSLYSPCLAVCNRGES